MTYENKTCLLMGGGLDSAGLYVWLHDRGVKFDTVVVDYEQKPFMMERIAATLLTNRYNEVPVVLKDKSIFDMNTKKPNLLMGTGTNPNVDFRNFGLILTAVAEGYDTIYLGITEPRWGDNQPEFFRALEAALNYSFEGRKIKIELPIIRWTKKEAASYGLEKFSDFFNLSRSCWSPDAHNEECGECKHCVEKLSLARELDAVWSLAEG